MNEPTAENLWDELHDQFGDRLRVVTRYDGATFKTVMREDLRAEYSSGDDQAIVDQTIVGQLNLTDMEEVFNAGALAAVVRIFETAYVISYPESLNGKAGVIVSLQRDNNSTQRTTVEDTIQYLADVFSDAS